jgi:DNA-binding response OmpR family regulator
MNLESILISKDAALIGVLRPTLENISVNVQICAEISDSSESLAKRKFDAVIIDCDDLQGGTGVLRDLRQTQSNSKSVAFAVLNGKTTTQEAFKLGANFVLQKPLTPRHATRCFHAALDFMIRERRRYFRYPVEIPLRVTASGSVEFTATSTNLSESGLALRAAHKLGKDTEVMVRFTLPEASTSLELQGRVAWADSTGRAGIQFVDVPQSSRYHLDKWLTERMAKEMPPTLQGHEL